MAAIVIYNEANTIAIISIFISLLSVASKSFVFMMGISNSVKQLFFNWLCAVTDFFGIFFVVCWVFYEPHDESLQEAFSVIQSVWLRKLYILEIPGVLFPAFFMYITFVWLVTDEADDSDTLCYKVLRAMFFIVFASFLLASGCIAGMLVAEITCWSWLGLVLYQLSSRRLPAYHQDSLQFYFTLLKWINSAEKHQVGSRYKGCTSYTKQQDKMMRLASANHVLVKDTDSVFQTYLKDHRTTDQYMKVTYRGLRNNVSELSLVRSQFIRKFWDYYGDLWMDVHGDQKRAYRDWSDDPSCHRFNECGFTITASITTGSMTFCFAPLYFISRIAHLVFPWFIVLYLYFGFDVVIWTSPHIDVFQMVMITVYLVLCSTLAVLLYLNAKEQYLLSHILPMKASLYRVNGDSSYLKDITNHYYGMTVIPIRRAIVLDHFGDDLGEIIVSYLPNDDEFENADHVLKVTTVV